GARRRGDRVLARRGCVYARAQRDQVCQLLDRLDVAERGQPGEPQRVEEIPAEQPQVFVGQVDQPAGPVVQEVTLEDALDEQRIFARIAPGPLPGRHYGPERLAVGRSRQRRRQLAALAQDQLGEL